MSLLLYLLLGRSGSLVFGSIATALPSVSLWLHALVLQELPEQSQRGLLVSSFLHQHIEDFAFVIDGPPKIHPLPCDPENAEAVASTIESAERDGAHSHGLFRLPGYIASLNSGKVNDRSRPKCSTRAPAVLHVDGDGGYAPMAHHAMLQPVEDMVRAQGVTVVAVTNTSHFSALWIEVEMLARRGLAIIACTSFKLAIPPAGETKPLFGTNPIAFGWPRLDREPMVFDQASSVMARGEVMLAARNGKTLPDGVGIGPDGKPTNDPNEILKGALLPYGGYKGASLVMMVELLAGPLIGENLSLEAARDDVADGGPPRGGEFLLIMDPARTRGDSAHSNHAEQLFLEIVR